VEAEVKARFPEARVTLIQGRGGVFDITCDGELIYCKNAIEGQPFPESGQIAALIAGRGGQTPQTMAKDV
jgi:predicted Rdx family selenoprotein